MTNPNIVLAASMLKKANYWRDYALATACPNRYKKADEYHWRFWYAYRYLMRRANRR
jgi:hypothetical protein